MALVLQKDIKAYLLEDDSNAALFMEDMIDDPVFQARVASMLRNWLNRTDNDSHYFWVSDFVLEYCIKKLDTISRIMAEDSDSYAAAVIDDSGC